MDASKHFLKKKKLKNKYELIECNKYLIITLKTIFGLGDFVNDLTLYITSDFCSNFDNHAKNIFSSQSAISNFAFKLLFFKSSMQLTLYT